MENIDFFVDSYGNMCFSSFRIRWITFKANHPFFFYITYEPISKRKSLSRPNTNICMQGQCLNAKTVKSFRYTSKVFEPIPKKVENLEKLAGKFENQLDLSEIKTFKRYQYELPLDSKGLENKSKTKANNLAEVFGSLDCQGYLTSYIVNHSIVTRDRSESRLEMSYVDEINSAPYESVMFTGKKLPLDQRLISVRDNSRIDDRLEFKEVKVPISAIGRVLEQEVSNFLKEQAAQSIIKSIGNEEVSLETERIEQINEENRIHSANQTSIENTSENLKRKKGLRAKLLRLLYRNLGGT